MVTAMYVLGLTDGHTATAALLRDGKIVGALSEERLNRQKNWFGFPRRAIAALLAREKITGRDVDLVVYAGLECLGALTHSDASLNTSYALLTGLHGGLTRVQRAVPAMRGVERRLARAVSTRYHVGVRQKRAAEVASFLGIPASRVVFADHHEMHAYAALCTSGQRDSTLLTADGEGDHVSATVNVSRDFALRRVAETSRFDSLGLLYMWTTVYLGMKPNEHEFKVMGLAPYASEYYVKRAYPVFERLIGLDETGLAFQSRVSAKLYLDELKRELDGMRFDAVAGALQRRTEELLARLAQNAVRETGVQNVAVGGGVFMNVKANKALMELPEVERFYAFPSGGDESLAIGAAFYGYHWWVHEHGGRFAPRRLGPLYLGTEHDDAEVEQFVEDQKLSKAYEVQKPRNMASAVADLLAQGEVVARCSGRMEWGARALGNRSILANPSHTDHVRVINEQIKSRDFWMPFCPSILKKREKDYVVNPKRVEAPYMILSFDSTERARQDIRAAMHPYDFTIRPQVLEPSWNPGYHDIIRAFEKKTGIGAVLNTSFNLHGEPVVESPADALHTLSDSGLEHLVLNNYLISKRGWKARAKKRGKAARGARGRAHQKRF